MKTWVSEAKGDDKIIFFSKDGIYKANPPASAMNDSVSAVQFQQLPDHHFFGILFRYITEINLQENRKYIDVLFRGDSELLKVNDNKTRREMFEFFKQHIPGANYSVVQQTKLQAIRKPLIALIVVSIIGGWTLFIASGIEAGNDYDVTGQHYDSIAGIVLALASMGVKKVCLVFGSLFLIAGLAVYRKFRNPVKKEVLQFSR